MKRSFKYFLYVFLPWAVVFLIFFTYFYLSESEKINSIRQESELLNVSLGDRAISKEFQAIISDLLILGEHNAFQSDTGSLSLSDLENLQKSFIVFAEKKGGYDQIRFLNNDGMEIVRVNYRKGKAIAVPEKSLQNKKERYYFKESVNMTKGMVYVSPLDLNVEHGKIEEPYKPMIRFGTPVFNVKGEKIGIVLLNYLADRLLGNFTSAVANIQDHAMIVNSEGYWLKHPQSNMEWGFMLNHGHNFVNVHPVPWEKITREKHGQFSNDYGMFTFTTMQLLHTEQQEYGADYKGLSYSTGKEYQWKVISHVSREIIQSDNDAILSTLIKISGPVFLLLFLVSWFLAMARVRSQKAADELSLAATVFEAASEGIIVTDAENQIKAVNSSFTQITGYSREEVVGETPAILNSGRQDGKFYREMWHSLLSRHHWDGEIWNKRKNGEIYPEWLSIVALADEQNNINSFVALFSDITVKKKTEDVLKRQATFDDLTGLPNRALFMDRLSRAILHSKRLESRFGLLFIDLDKFKAVNDSLGHTAGDQLLQKVARRIEHLVRESDTVARLGGDEFTLIFNNFTTHGDVSRIAGLIVEALSKPFNLNGQEANIGASIGIALYPEDGVDQTTLVNNADNAMYRAKQAGRNRYYFFAQEHEGEGSIGET